MSEGTAVDIYEAVIADLESRIAAMQSTIANLQGLRSGGVPSPSNTGQAQRSAVMSFSNDSFFGMTAAEASKKYLSAIKKTATIVAISEALLAGGWKTSAKNVSENLRTILSRHADFVRINGEFGLAEWYPGRKAATKKRATGVDEFPNQSDPMPSEPEQLSEQ